MAQVPGAYWAGRFGLIPLRGRGAFFLLFCSFASDLVTRPFSPPFRVDPGPLLVGSTDLNATADQQQRVLLRLRGAWVLVDALYNCKIAKNS